MSRWLDRLSGQTFEAIPEGPRLPGRFFDLEHGTWDEPNLVEPSTGEYLGSPPTTQEARELESTVAGHASSSFEDLVTAKPIARTHDIDLHWNEHDAELEEAVTLIERICRDPHTLLTTTTELEPVHRVRRTRSTALAYLAAHTEDWLHKGVVQVRPRRVRAERRDTVLDVYENRLVARLIDRVLKLIQVRLGKLEQRAVLYREVAESLESAFASPSQTSTTWEWRAQRLCQIWGDETPDEARDQIARETYRKLDDIAARAATCRSSELYRAISRYAPMDREPHMTNVLRSERRYRRAREHWVALAPSEAELIPPRPTTDFATFAAMLVVRALSQLGYEVTVASSPHRAIVDDGLGPVQLEHDQRGILLSRDGDLVLRFLPLPVRLDTLARGELFAMAGALGDAGPRTVLLCWKPKATTDSSDVPAPPRNGQDSAGLPHDPQRLKLELGILPVSPWDLGSVERVARALRWYLLAPQYLRYPLGLQPPPAALNVKALHIHIEDDHLLSTTLELVTIDDQLAQLREALSTQEEAAEAAHAAYQRARKARREFAQLEAQSDLAKQEARSLSLALAASAPWRDAFASALPIAKTVNRCPVCTKSGKLQRRDDGTFTFQCPNCESLWGVRRCLTCKKRLPFIEPPRGTYAPDVLADKTFGQDVLAIFAAPGSSTCAGCGPRSPTLQTTTD